MTDKLTRNKKPQPKPPPLPLRVPHDPPPPPWPRPVARHAKSAANPDWPYEHRCTGCGEEWPCDMETA